MEWKRLKGHLSHFFWISGYLGIRVTLKGCRELRELGVHWGPKCSGEDTAEGRGLPSVLSWKGWASKFHFPPIQLFDFDRQADFASDFCLSSQKTLICQIPPDPEAASRLSGSKMPNKRWDFLIWSSNLCVLQSFRISTPKRCHTIQNQ